MSVPVVAHAGTMSGAIFLASAFSIAGRIGVLISAWVVPLCNVRSYLKDIPMKSQRSIPTNLLTTAHAAETSFAMMERVSKRMIVLRHCTADVLY